MGDFALNLSADAARILRTALTDFCADADLRYAAVVQDSGIVLCEHGDPAFRDNGETGAVATGAFFAAQALAQRLGESEFSGLHYEGSARHFFLMSLTTEFFLLCVFANETRIAVVRACARRALPSLASALGRITSKSAEQGDLALSALPEHFAAVGGPFAPTAGRF
ncbi:MAG: roadblock/LC7 domain-containing protein [Verrucomicrobiales bacterium]